MSDETFAIFLAGRRWDIPHLPFRAIKTIQPVLFQIYNDAGGASMSTESIAALGEAQIERLALATWRAVAFVDPTLNYEAFLDLPFSVGDLLQSFPSVARAVGLRSDNDTATAEASPGAGKSTSTP